jgi:subtilisin family serine protease
MRTRAALQVAQILDEDPAPTVGVLVQVADPELVGDPLDESMGMSPRELLPGAITAPRPAMTVETMWQLNQDALAPLLASGPGKRAKASRTFWTSRTAYLELDRDDLARLLDEAPDVVAVHPDMEFTLPPVTETSAIPDAITENSTASWGITATGALSVWGAYGARGAGVTVGVLDTGVDATHPDLAGKIAAWAEFDAAGQPVLGSEPHDSADHGTHVCGTIAGGNASGQWIGMAPEAKLAVGLVLKGGSGSPKQVLAGIDWAAAQGVDVLSMSLSATLFTVDAPDVFTAAFVNCRRLGIPVVAAIGNRGTQTGASTGSDVFALAVGATDHRDVIAGFSGGLTQRLTSSPFVLPAKLPLIYTKPDLSAPGFAVLSSVPGGYGAKNGTSMATPHVAGAVALLLSAVPEIRDLHGEERAAFIQRQLLGSVDELGEAGKDSRYGWGRLNVLRAIALAKAAN